ncbi:hypothetical protein H0H93_006939 [Arthromyces matolae]|nr:hypothetical protein H0H93_006939 [Arthromyces matolae]
MRMTRIFVPTAIVSWFVICGVIAQDHQDLVVRELGPRNFLDKPQTQDSPTPQASSSSSNPEPTAAREEVLEKMVLEREKLKTEREKVVKKKDKDWKKKAALLTNRAFKKKLAIQGMQQDLPIRPMRLLDREHISRRLKNPKHPSLATLQQRVEQLEKERDEAQGKERDRLQTMLGNGRSRLKHNTMMEEIEAEIEAGRNPREAAAAVARSFRKRQQLALKTVDSVKKEIEELEMKIQQERPFLDPAELRKLQSKVSNLRTRTLKRALARSQKSQAFPSHNSNEEAEVEATSDSAASLTLTGTGILNSNLPGGDGLETEQDQDGDGHGGCFREDFDLYLWGKECNRQDLANHSNWQESEGQYYH